MPLTAMFPPCGIRLMVHPVLRHFQLPLLSILQTRILRQTLSGHAKIAGLRGEDFDIEIDEIIDEEDEFGEGEIDVDAFEDDE